MDWYFSKGEQQEGPVSIETLKSKVGSGLLAASDLVWKEGMAEWKPVSLVPEVAAFLPTVQAAQPAFSPPSTISPQGGVPAQAPVLVPMPNNGMAIASLVCGIGSLIMLMSCFIGILAGVPAVICGHMALKQIEESQVPVSGRGMAIAGLWTGYIAIALTVLFGILFGVLIASDSWQ